MDWFIGVLIALGLLLAVFGGALLAAVGVAVVMARREEELRTQLQKLEAVHAAHVTSVLTCIQAIVGTMSMLTKTLTEYGIVQATATTQLAQMVARIRRALIESGQHPENL